MEDLLKMVEEKIAVCRHFQSMIPTLEDLRDKLREMIAVAPVTVGHMANMALPSSIDPTSQITPTPTLHKRKKGEEAQPSVPDLSGATIKQAAIHVLSMPGVDWMEDKEIARSALQAGYRSPRHGDDLESVTYYFLDTLRRDKNTFQHRGHKIRLKPGISSGDRKAKKTAKSEVTLSRVAAEIVQRRGEPMRVSDIKDAIINENLWEPENPHTFYSAVYTAVLRAKDLLEKTPEGLWKPRTDDVATHNGAVRDSGRH